VQSDEVSRVLPINAICNNRCSTKRIVHYVLHLHILCPFGNKPTKVCRCQSNRSPQNAQYSKCPPTSCVHMVWARRNARCYCFKVRDQQKWKCQVDAGSSGAALFPLIPFTCRPCEIYMSASYSSLSASSIAAASNSWKDDGAAAATWESALIASLSVNQHMHSTPQIYASCVHAALFLPPGCPISSFIYLI
jgi:hypothetical protein